MFVAEVSALVTSGATVVKIIFSGRNVVIAVFVVVVVVIVGVGVVVTSGEVSGNIEVDVPASERPMLLYYDEYEIALKLLIP
jgi:hypothetical protein